MRVSAGKMWFSPDIVLSTGGVRWAKQFSYTNFHNYPRGIIPTVSDVVVSDDGVIVWCLTSE